MDRNPIAWLVFIHHAITTYVVSSYTNEGWHSKVDLCIGTLTLVAVACMVSSSHVQAWAGLPHIPRNPGDPTRAFAYVANCVQRHAIGLQAFLTYLFNRDLPIFDRLLSMLVQAGWSQVMILAVAASISIHQRVFGQRWAVALEEFAVTCAILAFHRLNLLDKWADQVWASISSAAPPDAQISLPGPSNFSSNSFGTEM